MSPGLREHNAAQKRFFERDPRRAATRFCRHPAYPRNLRRKFGLIAATFGGCRRLLEVGAGKGLELDYLLDLVGPDSTYFGLDVAFDPLAEARRGLGAHGRRRAFFAAGEAEGLPFADGAFDGVFCVDVLHHVASPAATLREVRRVLQPGGRVLCIEPNPLHPFNLIYLGDPIERGIFRLTRANAAAWVAAAGLAAPELSDLPIYFPAFPRSWGGLYDRAERLLAGVPLLRRLSTTRILAAVRPDGRTPP